MGVYVYPSDLHNSRTRAADEKCYFWACTTYFVLSVIIVYVVVAFSCVSFSIKDLDVLELDSLTTSNFNLSSRPTQIYADRNIQMNVKTRDKHGYYKFTKTKVSVYYNDKRIALANFTSFEVSAKNLPMHFGGKFSGSSG
ncbi:hypothetical protein POM88_034932 [Heracleum sosnowskyi]|uniref:Uncharacterized protein n=1 Tax=Heracleum sosnowskyi TaxID=360622 RepID=A0AAD8HK83_9APIA|nr:hypothetical protein POM88_034932 [Heracleum sosnowskyi]